MFHLQEFFKTSLQPENGHKITRKKKKISNKTKIKKQSRKNNNLKYVYSSLVVDIFSLYTSRVLALESLAST